MLKTKVAIEFFLSTTKTSVVSDVVFLLQEILIAHKASDTFVTMSGPYPDATSVTATTKVQNDDEGEADKRVGRGKRSADGDGDGDTVDAGDKPAGRGRGRPRKSAAGSDDGAPEARSTGSGRKRDAEGSSASEGRKRNVADGADEGADEGGGDREEGRRGAGRGRDADSRDRQASRISTGRDRGEEDDGWGDEPEADDTGDDEDQARILAAKSSHPWPDDLMPEEIDKSLITTLLSDHFTATGGKDRKLTFDLMEDVTGERAIRDVREGDYTPLAKALYKDIACYEFGLKKPKG